MKKKLILSVCIGFIICAPLFALEMELFGGPEFGYGIFKRDLHFWFRENTIPYYAGVNTKDLFFMPGLSFGLRVIPDREKNIFQQGFFFRGRALFIVNGRTNGTVSIETPASTIYDNISESYSIDDNESLTTIMNYDLGSSASYVLSDRIVFYMDVGINVTIMTLQSSQANEKFDYWGAGIYTALALQVNLTNKLYLEFGINTIHNILSSQEGSIKNPAPPYNIISFEDGGRWDFSSSAAYIHIGWRFSLDKAGKP